MKIVTDNVKCLGFTEVVKNMYNRDATHKAIFVSDKGEILEVLYKNPSEEFINDVISRGSQPIELYITTRNQKFFGKGD